MYGHPLGIGRGRIAEAGFEIAIAGSEHRQLPTFAQQLRQGGEQEVHAFLRRETADHGKQGPVIGLRQTHLGL